MTQEEIIAFVAGLGDDVLVLRPAAGGGTPPISWGDTFFYVSPDGTVPARRQPFATIVTKDYPGDASSRLDRPGVFRLNIAVGRDEARRHAGHDSAGVDPAAADTVFVHPVYGGVGWLAVVDPGPRTASVVRELLVAAHRRDQGRGPRRVTTGPAAGGPG
ncbi:DUF6194 family protein [Solwaraspora sp. WMMD791]|uniref:DUF6194 family protein n=1 Tax=Solwaraspora sp. WMMD791 TaxID=3016086 RepID=UPI002499F338|nr:DUF6194 family protein [Solwaraspora sp. WMMD791]WFE28527.1 DUF6194 family protein [Solwaraspora sp. WMMD791]